MLFNFPNKKNPTDQKKVPPKRIKITLRYIISRKETITFFLTSVAIAATLIFLSKEIINSTKNYLLDAEKHSYVTTQNQKLVITPSLEILATLPPKDENITYHLTFNPNSKRVIYRVTKKIEDGSEIQYLVTNGQVGKTHKDVKYALVSPDGQRVGYIVKENEKEFVVIDEIEGKKYDFVKNLEFSPNGKHYAYAAGEDKYFHPYSEYDGADKVRSMFMVIDGKEEQAYDGIEADEYPNDSTYRPVFSKDGKKIAYTAIKSNKKIIVMGDEELSGYGSQKYPQFIGDSYDLVYLASEGQDKFLVVDGKKWGNTKDITTVGIPYYISKDGSHIAYQTFQDNDFYLLFDNTSYKIPRGSVSNLDFSNTRKYVSYSAGKLGSYNFFVNGSSIGKVTAGGFPPTFSANDKWLAFLETTESHNENSEGKLVVFLNIVSPESPHKKVLNTLLGYFEAVGPLKFSEDGNFIYFKALHGRDIVFASLNITSLGN